MYAHDNLEMPGIVKWRHIYVPILPYQAFLDEFIFYQEQFHILFIRSNSKIFPDFFKF